MPTYEYECERCGRVLEKFQRITDAPLKRCPLCRGKVNRRIGTGAGVIFKGSGFYCTDYRSESYKKAVQAEKSGGSAESKPQDNAAKSAAAKGKSA